VALVSGPVNRIAGVVSTAFSAAVTAISGFIGRARTAAASVGKAIIDAVTGFVGRMAGIGGDIVQGLINGITGMAGALAGAISSFISNNVPGPIRKLLHLGSPSKLTEQFGKWTTEGLINGLVADASGVRGAAALLAKNAASGFGLNLPAVSMAGGAPSMAASSGPTAVGNMGSSAATTTYGNVNITISVDDLDKMSKVSDFIDRLNGARMNQRRQVGSVNG
jgi:phage-related protein